MQYLDNKLPPALVALIAAAGMWVIALNTPIIPVDPTLKNVIVGIICFIGSVFSVLGVLAFRHAKTTVNPLRPESTASLVTTGIYRVSRNPMYVGFATFLLAWGVHLSSVYSMVLIIGYVIYIQRFQIIPEERILEKTFGQAFIIYKSKVRPWL